MQIVCAVNGIRVHCKSGCVWVFFSCNHKKYLCYGKNNEESKFFFFKINTMCHIVRDYDIFFQRPRLYCM